MTHVGRPNKESPQAFIKVMWGTDKARTARTFRGQHFYDTKEEAQTAARLLRAKKIHARTYTVVGGRYRPPRYLMMIPIDMNMREETLYWRFIEKTGWDKLLDGADIRLSTWLERSHHWRGRHKYRKRRKKKITPII